MMLQYLRQKLRLFRFDRKKKKTGGIYHHHFHEIPDGDSTLKLYPGDVPRCQTLSYVLAKLPDALSQKIINEEFIEDHIMF